MSEATADGRGTPGLREALRELYADLCREAVRGVVSELTFRVRAQAIGLGEAEQIRLRAELARMGLTVRQVGAHHAQGDSSRPRMVAPDPGAGRVGAARALLARYADGEGRVSTRAVEGVARLAGLDARETRELRESARLLPEEGSGEHAPGARAGHAGTGAVEAGSGRGPDAEAGAGGGGDTRGLARAVAAARAVLDDDRFTRQPGRRLLTAEEEVGLGVLIRGGAAAIVVAPTEREVADLPATDIRIAARNCLVAHNTRLVWKIATRYAEQGLDMDDLAQHGILGLLRAAVKFDPAMGNKFSTYATWWIRQSITRAIADEGAVIRIPVHMHETMRKVGLAERQLQSQGRPARAADVAVACDLSVHRVEEVRRLSRRTDSLDRVVGDGAHLGDLVALAHPLPSTEQLVMGTLQHDYLQHVLDTLGEREARIVQRRTGFDGEDPATLEELGREFGVTRERVRQLEGKAFEALRGKLLAAGFGPGHVEPPDPPSPSARRFRATRRPSARRGAGGPSASYRAAGRQAAPRGPAARTPVGGRPSGDAGRPDRRPPGRGVTGQRPPGRAAHDQGVPGGAGIPVPVREERHPVSARAADGPAAPPGEEPTAAAESSAGRTAREAADGKAADMSRYTADWQQAVRLSARSDGGAVGLAEYALLALGHLQLAVLLGRSGADRVVAAVRDRRLDDRQVVTALEVLHRVFDTLKGAGLRPEDFFERPCAVLKGVTPRRYLADRPLVGGESRVAIRDALREFAAHVMPIPEELGAVDPDAVRERVPAVAEDREDRGTGEPAVRAPRSEPVLPTGAGARDEAGAEVDSRGEGSGSEPPAEAAPDASPAVPGGGLAPPDSALPGAAGALDEERRDEEHEERGEQPDEPDTPAESAAMTAAAEVAVEPAAGTAAGSGAEGVEEAAAEGAPPEATAEGTPPHPPVTAPPVPPGVDHEQLLALREEYEIQLTVALEEYEERLDRSYADREAAERRLRAEHERALDAERRRAEAELAAARADTDRQLDELEAVLLRRVDLALLRQERSLRHEAGERLERLRGGTHQAPEAAHPRLAAHQAPEADPGPDPRITELEARLRQSEAESARRDEALRQAEELAASRVQAVERWAAHQIAKAERTAAQRAARAAHDTGLRITELQAQLEAARSTGSRPAPRDEPGRD
ncbi:sigma-70 family RNA polymerase sigma factor [Streptomyces sp. NPDC004609]|uniref:sigma-70 family RNA polymerase sigma factor n=1 Tax=Streptomyces sp. NPDC004609 TaxID=3364704 RepID=UPI0036A3500D